MVEIKSIPKAARGLRVLTDEVLDGFAIEDIKCRSCSGYGNCGYKSMYLNPAGGVVSICMNRREQLQKKRDGVAAE
ncbi:hypothetical protein C1878_11625 [Gordonibacter sp. 28C]|uniref:hypothetical protein n=1 Tax=Gordonibacter sp. 28C TaxID=2078569 RepID=UPI000DF8642E|nr:hypothetical protein [Gordonibacter sp. 28C]RDB61360.1 hypothetical protein C1878_11625 [Gordonibacter sp. 28C]